MDGHDELWTSDGTAESTRPVAGSDTSSDRIFINEIVAAGDGGVYKSGRGLWTADAASARSLGSWDASIFGLTTLGERVFFTASEEATGRELWTSDGTEDGTALLVDLHRGPGSSRPAALTVVDERVVFTASTGAGSGTFSSDGTAGGTARLPGPGSIAEFFLHDGRLFYCSALAEGLWQTDGTAAGTFESAPKPLGCRSFLSLGDEPLFAGGMRLPSSDTEPDVELWASDGTAAGTRLLRDIEETITGSVEPRPLSSSPGGLTLLSEGVAVFSAARIVAGRELWRTDGTMAGTRLVRELCLEERCSSDPGEFVRIGDRIVFAGTHAVDGREPWTTDGTARGTRRLGSLNPGAAGSDPHGFTLLGDAVVFFARQNASEKLWTTDAAPAGTRRVRNLAFGGRPSFVIEVEHVESRIFFTLYNRRTGAELWVSDGTSGGTRQVSEIAAGRAGAFPSGLTAVDDVVVFAASDAEHGVELWVSDATAAGTRMIQDLDPGPASSAPREFTAAGELIYFRADTAAGSELWAVPRGALLAFP